MATKGEEDAEPLLPSSSVDPNWERAVVVSRVELEVAAGGVAEEGAHLAALPLEERCGDDCKFILPTYIGEQESRAQIHLYQLAVWAHGLGRILVLPSVKHSRYSACYSQPFEFYYEPDTLARLGLPTVSKAEYLAWTKARASRPPTAQLVRVRNPTIKGVRIPHPSPMVWNDATVPDYPRASTCLSAGLDFSGFHPVSFYGTGWNAIPPPGELDFLASVWSTLRTPIGAISPSSSLPQVLYFHMEGQHSPSFTPADLVALSPSTPLAHPFSIFPYSQPLVSLASAMTSHLSPYIAVQWRTEEVDPSHLVPCGRTLMSLLAAAKRTDPALSAVYLATDYPFDSLRDTSISSEAHSQSYKIPKAAHVAMKTFRSEWEAEVDKGGLPRITTWDEEEKYLEVPEESKVLFGTGEHLRDTDIALLGMVDKMVATQAELFFAGEEHKCGKLSSYMKAIADVREEVVAEGKSSIGTPGEHGTHGGDLEMSPFSELNDNKKLDPNSPEFDVREWVSSLLNITSRDPERFPTRSAGVSFSSLNVYGFGSSTDYQKTVGNAPLGWFGAAARLVGPGAPLQKIRILRDFEGLVESGEMLIVLGRPGSGCSTLLKTIAGETHGFYLEEGSNLQYQGIPMETMQHDFRGEVIYNAETDVHFPNLTVGETLSFAARARAPRNRLPGVTRAQFAEHIRDVVMTIYGLSHKVNTKVGNDFIRGVSGGERKRVSIAECTLSFSPLQCWDNSTRGLDSANALEFVKSLRLMTQSAGSTAAVAIYQSSQSAYDVFDKVIVLYEGYEIYFGRCGDAKEFFTSRGYICPARQTTADFLTSLTNPAERVIAPGWESKEFSKVWKESPERAQLLEDIKAYEARYPLGGATLEQFRKSRKAAQAKGMSIKDPYTLSIPQQIELCMVRGFQRLKADQANMWITILGNFFMALIVASVVEKHQRFALYHPFAEALSSMLCDMPTKILVAITFNLALYFMTNLRREPGPFFFFLLMSFGATLTMSSIFRTMAATSRTLQGALAPAAVFSLVTYTGFALPVTSMHGWSRWMNYLDAFEALMVNEFHDRTFPCTSFVPTGAGYENVTGTERSCSVVGSVAGSSVVNGDDYINQSFQYFHSIAFWVGFTVIYLVATEYISAQRSKGEVLVFRRGHGAKRQEEDEEAGAARVQTRRDNADPNEKINIHRQTATFSWEDVCYDIKIKGEGRRILSNVDGWVKPGTLTALMGATGAGKTTLLDVLANRVTMGIITGSIFVDGEHRDKSFQRKQDLHLETATVRESLNFSALCRQPKATSKADKLAYVEEVIKILEMEDYADAVVGVPGEGLNVEQRKRLTIGVELAAKPDLLLFLDEPSSGLDSQTAWSMVRLCRKLANSGQAILCTIHQPSAILMAEFDRLLFLARGGRTVYFGDIGPNCGTLVNYFERNGAEPCDPEANPAEWMLAVIGAAPGSHTTIDWHETWRKSDEYGKVHTQLAEIKAHKGPGEKVEADPTDPESGSDEFAMPFAHQLWYCFWRVWAQYWRTPSYLYAKTALCTIASIFVGFSFYMESGTSQGLQNQMFSIFMLLTIFGSLCQQLMPLFVSQRALYEARERPSKTYSWVAFITSQILVEIPWQTLMAVITFFCWYYPIGLYRNASLDHAVTERGGLMFLFVWSFYLFTSTFAQMCIAAIEVAEVGGTLANFAFSLTLIFCGVLATPSQFPHFWIFLYRVSPFTYIVAGMLTTGVSGAILHCDDVSLTHLVPPAGETCQSYLAPYISANGGSLYGDALSTTSCEFCTASTGDAYLAQLGMSFDTAWRNWGLMWAYIVFNIAGAVFLYWLARVPKKSGAKVIKKE
ncbi:hypothetical protein RQP46_008045 [Phenoliferia psychrophenolica]